MKFRNPYGKEKIRFDFILIKIKASKRLHMKFKNQYGKEKLHFEFILIKIKTYDMPN